MSDFFETPADYDEKTILLQKARELRQSVVKKKIYVNDDVVEQRTNEAFNFELEKKYVIDSLNELKTLSVEEFTFKKKWEEVCESQDHSMFQNAGQFKARIWAPTDLHNEELTIKEISELEPEIIIVQESNHTDAEMWSALRLFFVV